MRPTTDLTRSVGKSCIERATAKVGIRLPGDSFVVTRTARGVKVTALAAGNVE